MAAQYTGVAIDTSVSAEGQSLLQALAAQGLFLTPLHDHGYWYRYHELFAESDPVFTATEDWTGGDVDRPEARLTPDGWVMLYAGNDLNSRGLALSQDGIDWMPAAENPVMTSRQFPIPGTTWDTSLLYHDDTYYYYMEIGSMAGTDIYVATHRGSIPP